METLTKSRLYIVNYDDPSDKIYILFTPSQVHYTGKSEFVAIPSPGRNNPLYHYTGAEDSLEFELDWISEKESREDVIRKCQWLESFSKNDGRKAPPSPIQLVWDQFLFNEENSKWLVVRAPYKLKRFDGGFSTLPVKAVQKVTLKRITPFSRSTKQIRW